MSQRPTEDEADVIEFIRSVDVRAPERLHRSTQALIAARADTAAHGVRVRIGAATALAAAAAVVIALVVGSGPGTTHALDLRSAAAPTLRAATMAAPRESGMRHSQLTAAVDGIAFPYWAERFGWSAAGARHDRIGGRTVTTVFYRDGAGQRIAYAIVGGMPAPRVQAQSVAWLGGTAYGLSTVAGRRVVTWERAGHLCVVAGRGVSDATLLRLASWGEHGTAA